MTRILFLAATPQGTPPDNYWLAIALGWIGGCEAAAVLLRLKEVEPEPLAQSGVDKALKTVPAAEFA